QRGPRRGAGQLGHPLAVGYALTPAVATPAPVVERARDFISLHLALGEVAAHVPAVAVEHVDPAVTAAENHELLAERGNGVRLAVAEVLGQSQGVPAASKSGWDRLGFDLPNLVGVRLQRHLRTVLARGLVPNIYPPFSHRRGLVSHWQGKTVRRI